MSRTVNALNLVTRFALLSLMLAVQGMAYAHEVDHLAPVDANDCAACVAGHAFGAAVPAAHSPPAVERVAAPASAFPAAAPPRLAPRPFSARGPPEHS